MSQNLTVWEYNGVELSFDLAEASDAKKYDEEFRKLGEKENTFNRDVPNYEIIISYCKLYQDLFDGLFGSGTFAKLTGGKVQNINAAHDVYDSFLCFCKNQSDNILDVKNRFTGKYSPNRAQRRAGKRG